MKHRIKKIWEPSISRQFAGIFIGLMAGTILLCWFANNTFLKKYYMAYKIKVIDSAYSKINTGADELEDTAFQEETDEFCFQNNITILVIDSDSRLVYASGNGGAGELFRLGNLIFVNKGFAAAGKGSLSIARDMGNEYLELVGTTDSGYPFLIRSPMESIRISVKLANQFLAYVGLAMAALSGMVIWVVTRRMTRPIRQLTEISGRMIHLDFDAKYKGRSNNELGRLGHNINRLSEALEETISELKTANNELKKDIEKKEQIDEMRKEFLANVSHELKTPIALIQGYAEGLREGIHEDAESRDFYCEVIMDEAARMNTMVQKLMTLNQLEFGKDPVTMERFDLTELVSAYVQSAKLLATQNGIEVRLDAEAQTSVCVWGDAFKAEEVLMNYFSNALNHCAGERIIEVKIKTYQGKARVSVFNTGTPIPEEALPRLWDKFYKVDKARTRAYGGSGIGLSIVKAIMESMNCGYGVTNYDNGVQFWFELELV